LKLEYRFEAASLVFPNGEKLCINWVTAASLQNAIVYLTSIAINVLNMIIVAVLKSKKFFSTKAFTSVKRILKFSYPY